MAIISENISTEVDAKYVVENNTFLAVAKADALDKIAVEVGDSKQVDFYPQAKITRWDNEVNFSVRLVDESMSTAVVSTDKENIIYTSDNYEAHFYDKAGASTSGGYELEVILKEKPKSNILNFTIETKGLLFGKQKELTEEEINAGFIRPENVIDSYAVYHESKGVVNNSDGMDYKGGKFCHIYRPKIIDAKGNWVWGDLNIDIDSKLLTITIPQYFLDESTYPVIVDPTFGYESAGASNISLENAICGGRFVISENGTGVSMTAITNPSATDSDFKMALYDNGDGDTDESVSPITNGQTAEHDTISTGQASRSADFSTGPTLTSGTSYRLAAWAESITGTHVIYYDSSISGAYSYIRAGVTYGTWPNPLSSWTDYANTRMSIYCTYTSASTPETALFDCKIRIKDSSTSLLDGKVIMKDTTSSVFDCKVIIKDAVVSLVDGKVSIKDTATSLLDAKIKIADSVASLLDGKIIIKDSVTNLLDGKLEISSVGSSTDYVDGKITIKDTTISLVDGKIVVKDSETKLLDGKVLIKEAETSLLDGKLVIKDYALTTLDGKIIITDGTEATLNKNNSLLLDSLGGKVLQLGNSKINTWNTAGRPTGKLGIIGLNTETSNLEVYNGTAWVVINLT